MPIVTRGSCCVRIVTPPGHCSQDLVEMEIFLISTTKTGRKPYETYLPVVNLKITLPLAIRYESLQSSHDAPLSLDYTCM